MFHLPRPTGRIAVPDTQAVLMITTKLDIRLLTRLDIAEDNREMTDLQTGTDNCLFAFIYFTFKILYFLRYSSRSERSDYEREYRNTPPRDNRRRSSRDEDFPGSGRDYAHDYSRRDKRNDRVKERHGKIC